MIRRNRGYSRLELLVSISLVGLLMSGLLGTALYYQELAESVALRMTLSNLRSGMHYRMAELAIRQGREDFTPLLEENPLTWLAPPPEVAPMALFEADPEARLREMQGDRQRSDAEPAVSDRWQYLPQQRELIYRPRLHFFLRGAEGQPLRELRFRLRGIVAGAPSETSAKGVQGLRIEPVVAYSWL